MDQATKIVAVNYSNTFPFVYGIEKSGLISDYILQLLHPVACAESFISGHADIALLPVGALSLLPEHKIITDMCIGAVQQVRSVLLVSNKPLQEIKRIGLDSESATSVKLCKILAANFWNISPEFQAVQVKDHKDFSNIDAFVVIGDKAFAMAPHFKYSYDLAEEWYNFTGMSFVFAVWVSRLQVSEAIVHKLKLALHFGVAHIPKVVKHYSSQFCGSFDLEDYLSNCIDYRFDKLKKVSLEKFLGYVAKDF
jgi:chorismate dehydratase